MFRFLSCGPNTVSYMSWDRGCARVAGKPEADARGGVVEECEVPIEAVADDNGSNDSDSDLDPDGCAPLLLAWSLCTTQRAVPPATF